MTSAIINKILHQPIAMLKQSEDDSSGDAYVDAVRALFDLAAPDPDEAAEQNNPEDDES